MEPNRTDDTRHAAVGYRTSELRRLGSELRWARTRQAVPGARRAGGLLLAARHALGRVLVRAGEALLGRREVPAATGR